MPEAKKLNRRRAGRFSLLFTIYNLCNLWWESAMGSDGKHSTDGRQT